MCVEKTHRLKDEIVANRSASSAMGEAINVRLDDIKDLILKNGKNKKCILACENRDKKCNRCVFYSKYKPRKQDE